MPRPLAYVTAAWSTYDSVTMMVQANSFCRRVYEAGYNPICPMMMHKGFIHEDDVQEKGDAVSMASDILRRCRILVVCGKAKDKQVQDDMALASRLNIVSSTLEGIEQAAGISSK